LSQVVGVLGGSFDPVHDAHLALARRALEQVPCDEVWFLPADRAVHKPTGPLADAERRRVMLELALADEPGMKICPLELAAARPMRSLESLSELKATWPGNRWYFLLGEDSFRAIDSWYRPDALFAIAPPVVLPRPGSTGERTQSYAGQPVTWLEGEELDLDSTSLRTRLAAGQKPDGLSPAVLDYILAHGLYREQCS